MSYLFSPALSASVRLEYIRRENLSGRDPSIGGPQLETDEQLTLGLQKAF